MANIETIDDLRSHLANELKRVADGETTPASANASANIAGKLLSTIKIELEYNKMVGTTPHISFIKSYKKDEAPKIEAKGESK